MIREGTHGVGCEAKNTLKMDNDQSGSKISVYNILSVHIYACIFFSLPCGVRVRPSPVFSGTPKLHPFVFSVFFVFSFFPADRIHEPKGARNKNKIFPVMCMFYRYTVSARSTSRSAT